MFYLYNVSESWESKCQRNTVANSCYNPYQTKMSRYIPGCTN